MSTTTEQSRELARRFGEVLNNRQWELLDDIVAPDFQRHCQATPQISVNNREEFKEFLRQDAMSFPDSVQTLLHLVAERDLVAVWIHYEGTQRGQLGPFPPSGKKMQIDASAFLRIEKDEIAEMWVTWDNLTALIQLGHLPGPS